jgi:antagonist of KipI
MQIRILKPGILSTVQDMGRLLYLSQAVPVSGAMDTLSARIANKAVGNDDNSAVIEFTYANATFKAETDLLMAYVGDGAILKADEQQLPSEKPIFIPIGTVIKLINNSAGSRTYLSIVSGWDVAPTLDSKSTYLTAGFGGLDGRALKTGDVLNNTCELTSIGEGILSSLTGDQINYPQWSIFRQLLLPSNRKIIRVVPAREFNWFGGSSIYDFLSTPYTLSMRSNRMGYHLEGAPINRLKKDELLSTAVAPGTIQVTGNGSMILLMADCQTTGGYPRIAQVAAVDLPLCAQLKPGDAIYFKEINKQEAEMLYLEREQQLHKLTTAISSRFL